MRFNLSIAIVAMVKRNSSIIPTPTNSSYMNSNYTTSFVNAAPACPLPPKHNGSHIADFDLLSLSDGSEGEFDWNEKEQGIILGMHLSFNYYL